MIILQLFGVLFCIISPNLSDNHEKEWNLHGISGGGYYIATEIGTPSQKFNLLLDTGSSNLAVAGFLYPGLDSYYIPESSHSSISDNKTNINVQYFQGSWEGYLARDIFLIPGINVEPIMTDIAVIQTAEGFYVNDSHWQGILGLGYKSIAKPNGTVMPWLDSLKEHYPEKNSFSLELCGPDFSTGRDKHYGHFSIDDKNCPSSNYSTGIFREDFYETLITEFHIGGKKLAVSCVQLNSPRTIIDSGTTNLQLPSDIYKTVIVKLKENALQNGLRFPSQFWHNGGVTCLVLSLQEWKKLADITIYFNAHDGFQFGVNIPPSSYLRPSLGASNSSHACVYLGIEQSHAGTVLGAVVLEGFCVHFDRQHKKIFFSKSHCGPEVNILELYNPDIPHCFYVPSAVNGPLIASVVIFLLITLPLLMVVSKWAYEQILHRRRENSIPFITLPDGVT